MADRPPATRLSAQNDGGNPVVEAGKATGAGAADLDAQLMGYVVGAAGSGDGRPAGLAARVPDEATRWGHVGVELGHGGLDIGLASSAIGSAE
jgi:hypothetical protein